MYTITCLLVGIIGMSGCDLILTEKTINIQTNENEHSNRETPQLSNEAKRFL